MTNLDPAFKPARRSPLYCYLGDVVPCYNAWQESNPDQPGTRHWKEEQDFEAVLYIKVNEIYAAQPSSHLTPAFDAIANDWERLRQFPRKSIHTPSAEVDEGAAAPLYFSRKLLRDEIRIVLSSPDEGTTRAAA